MQEANSVQGRSLLEEQRGKSPEGEDRKQHCHPLEAKGCQKRGHAKANRREKADAKGRRARAGSSAVCHDTALIMAHTGQHEYKRALI